MSLTQGSPKGHPRVAPGTKLEFFYIRGCYPTQFFTRNPNPRSDLKSEVVWVPNWVVSVYRVNVFTFINYLNGTGFER